MSQTFLSLYEPDFKTVFRTIFHPKRDVFHFNMLFQSSLGLNKQINTLIAKESLLRASFSTVSLQQF